MYFCLCLFYYVMCCLLNISVSYFIPLCKYNKFRLCCETFIILFVYKSLQNYMWLIVRYLYRHNQHAVTMICAKRRIILCP